eukprot:scaffold126767_cov69-Phaeocystis_antarctica.AAC.1
MSKPTSAKSATEMICVWYAGTKGIWRISSSRSKLAHWPGCEAGGQPVSRGASEACTLDMTTWKSGLAYEKTLKMV